MSSSCSICGNDNGTLVKVTEKGLNTLMECSRKREDNVLTESFEEARKNHFDIWVHNECRKPYTDKRKLLSTVKARETRKTSPPFEFSKNCLFCDEVCISDNKNPSRESWFYISNVKFKETILKGCSIRLNADVEA